MTDKILLSLTIRTIRTVFNVHLHKRCFQELAGEQVVSNCEILACHKLPPKPFNKAFQINNKTPQIVFVEVVGVRRLK